MSAGRTGRHTHPASEGSFSLAEFARKRDGWLAAFYERLPSDALRSFVRALFERAPDPGVDAEAYFALLRFLFGFGRPSNIARDKAAGVRSLGTLERALAHRTTIHDLTPLHLAAIGGHLGLTRALLETAAREGSTDLVVQATDAQGYTPLHFAVAFGHRRLWSELLEAGARDEVTTNLGATAGDLAHRLGRDDYLADTGQRADPLVPLIDPGDGQGVRPASDELLQKLPVALQPWTRLSPEVFNALYLESVGPLDLVISNLALSHGFAAHFDACERVNPSALYLGRVTADDEGQALGDIGWGLFARRDLPAGHMISYGGVVQLLSQHVPSDRNMHIDARHSVWKTCVVEGTHQSNLGTFVNHGFPNCVWDNMIHRGAMEVVLLTAEPIPAGTQLTARYGFEVERARRFFELHPGRRRRFLAERYAEEVGRLARYAEPRPNDLKELSLDAFVETMGAFTKLEYLHARWVIHRIGGFEPHPVFEQFVRRHLRPRSMGPLRPQAPFKAS